MYTAKNLQISAWVKKKLTIFKNYKNIIFDKKGPLGEGGAN